MFTNISWSEYSIFIGTIVITYYALVLTLYYKREILNAVSSFRIGRQNFKVLPVDNPTESEFIAYLKNDIVEQLERAAIKKFARKEIILSFQLLLQKYDSIKHSQSKHLINDYIKAACKNICSIHLEDAELDQLWFR